MKKSVFISLLLLFASFTTISAQRAGQKSLKQRIEDIEDRMALKNLVDTFSTLSDTKEAELQGELFTKDATVKTYYNGQLLADLKGRKQIADTFGAYLGTLESLYHINGQQTITLKGNTATGICYCQVTIIEKHDGKRTITMQGVRYQDEYQKINGRWYIKNRISNFMWRDTRNYQ